MWSVENFTSSLAKISKSSFQFRELATTLMTANTPSMYKKAVKDINDYIESKAKRSFLRGFVNIWNPHRHYFTGHAANLTLLDAVYQDTEAAISLGRFLELFGEGFKCQGAGPTQKETNSRKRKSQKVKVNT